MVGSTGPRMEICETSRLPTAMVPCLLQSNGYIKTNVQVCRAQNCNAPVGAESPLTCADRKVPRSMGGSIGPRMEICEIFWPTNSHGTAFAPKQWFHQKEATGMESSKM